MNEAADNESTLPARVRQNAKAPGSDGDLIQHHTTGRRIAMAGSILILVVFGWGCCLSLAGAQLSVGDKSLLFIRLDFPDIQGPPESDSRAAEVMRTVDDYYRTVSDGKLSITPTLTPTLRMPHPASWYAKHHDERNSDARAAAKAAGFDPDKFDLEIMVFDRSVGGDGFGIFRGKGVWLAPPISFSGVAHELGHNFGLPHSAVWKAWSGGIIGPGMPMIYADAYDPMGGSGDDTRAHFSSRSKAMLGWWGPRDIATVISSGRYRIYAEDLPGAPGPRAIRIPIDGTNEYWIEFRQLIIDNAFMMNGVRILKCFSDISGKVEMTLSLLDMTPDFQLGSKDAPLLLGRTFADDQDGIYVTPIDKGHTTPESVDIQVNIGRFPYRPTPTFSATANPEACSVGAPVTFRAVVNGPLYSKWQYSWDFGDGTFAWSKAMVTHSYQKEGTFLARCGITDMKGFTADKWIVIHVGQTPNDLLRGSVTVGSKPLENVLVADDVGSNTRTDSDGTFAFTELKPGHHRISARMSGYWFDSQTADFPTAEAVHLTGTPLNSRVITRENGFVLQGEDCLSTPELFRPPVDITIVAKTAATNLRLGYAADDIIFNWEVDGTELRVDGGPANGKHKKDVGAIPVGQYVTIRWIVTQKRQSIFVDGKLRFEDRGDYSQICRPVSVFTHQSTVTVKMIKVTPLPLGTE